MNLIQKVIIKDEYGREFNTIMVIYRIKYRNIGYIITSNAEYEDCCQLFWKYPNVPTM